MRVNRAERRNHQRRSGYDRRVQEDRRKFDRNTPDRRQGERRKEIRREEDFQEEKRFDDQIEGRNSVLELLESGKDINKIFVTRGEKHGSINKILAIAKERKIIVVEKDKKQMDEMAQEDNYQGVIAIVPPFEYVEIEDILNDAKEKQEDAFILILDGIEDPHNLGAIIRTANQAGAHGVIIPKNRAVGLTATVAKTSAGALNYTPVAKVTNIGKTIEDLKKEGLWFVCADMDGTTMYNLDLKGPIGLVIGNEGDGVSRLVKEKCDFVASIPMKGDIDSLNASVAAGVLAYEIVRQRLL